MNKLNEKINSLKDISKLKGCSEKQINEAEEKLSIKFPNEYKEYVIEFGAIQFNSHEWTGLNINGYLNVVEATEELKNENKNFPEKYFVLENTLIDSIYIIVDEKGVVYSFQGKSKKKLSNSIKEYLEMCLK